MRSRDLALKLAKRALAVPKIVEHLWMMSTLTLELLKERSNTGKSAIARMMSGKPADENAQAVLQYGKIERVPLEDTPANTQRIAKETRQKFKKDKRDAEGRFSSGNDCPIMTVYFVTEEDLTGRDAALSAAYAIPIWYLAYVASNPKLTFRTAILGDTDVDLSVDALVDSVNALVSMDKQNKLRLRGYPQPQPEDSSPSESSQKKSAVEEPEVDKILSQLGATTITSDAVPTGEIAAAMD